MRLLVLALTFVVAWAVPAPTIAHEGHPEHDAGKHEQGWPGSTKAQELARAMLADSQPAVDAAPQSGQSCVNGFAGEYRCNNVDLMAFMPLGEIGGGNANDIWGWTDPLNGDEYALLGRTSGTSFVRITDPFNPVYVGNLPTTRFSSTWRDLKVYGNHVFVVSESRNHGMQVFDLTRLRGRTGPTTFSADARYTGFATAHNIAINEDSGYAYAVGTDTCSGGLHIVDIRDPLRPTQAGCYSADGYTHDVQCVNYQGPDAAHAGREICFAANEDTVTIIDVTNKSAPTQLARVSYPGVRYTHQGWLTEDQRYFLVDDELDEQRDGHNTHTYVFDLLDVDAPTLIHTYVGTTGAIDHNQYIVGNHSYQSNYRAGLRIIDISNKTALTEVAYFDTYPADDSTDFNGTWSNYPFFRSGTVIASSIERGLFILRPNLGPSDGQPSVSLGSPGDGATVAGNVAIEVSASDVEDDPGSLTVEWSVDGGATWRPTTYDAVADTYAASWATTEVPDGSYAVTARAMDSANQSATDTHAVTVDNVADPSPTAHVGDLDGRFEVKGKSGRWEVFVSVTVHDGGENPLGGVVVTGTFTGDATGSVSGTTAADGTVVFATGTLNAGTSVTFTVAALDGVAPTTSHDVDGETDGTTVTVTRT